MKPIILDVKYLGIEGGVRVYTDIAPALTARDYKDPLRVVVSVEPRTPKTVPDVANGLTCTPKDNLVMECEDEQG